MSAALIAAAGWHVLTHEVLGFASVGIAVSTIDDIIIDSVYLWLVVHGRTRPGPLPGVADDAGWIAIIVPAWDEAGVIGAMLAALTRCLDYERYVVFVGVYPNDPATRADVESVGDPRIVVVECTRPGPTTKADCLNHLWRAVVRHEAVADVSFKAVVLHDAEDVVDPAELRVFDAAIPALAMVQLPVVPLIDRTSRWISGHYIDEFAEAHRKDLFVRGALGAGVPSAGVACGIDRAVLGQLAGHDDAPFDPASMTEDYELGMRIAALGRCGALVRIRGTRGAVATREHFPATFDTALRQKTRWLLGIALDGWDRIGWSRGLANRYMLLRDRKAIVAPLLVGAGYVAVAMCGIDAAIAWALPAAARFPAIAPRGSVLAALLLVNAATLGWRIGLRAAFTGATHGWREGARAVPRTIVANGINAVAAVKALRRYARIRAGREVPRWDKTAHRFPAAEQTAASE
jgi:adsorption protein B